MKTCRICTKEKPLEQFTPRADYKDGRDSVCKQCRTDQTREWYRRKTTTLPKKRPWQTAETSATLTAGTSRLYYERHKNTKQAKLKDWREKNPAATKAHRDLNNAIRLGKITKPIICERCGKTGRLDGHHHDYSKPLEVEWLCRSCHTQETRKEQQSA